MVEVRQTRRSANGSVTGSIRVWPASEAIRKLMKHPAGIKFRETLDESVEWPLDTFTRRRIADGDVLTKK